MRPTATSSRPDRPNGSATGYGWGNAKGVTGPVGPGKDVTRLPSCPDDVSGDEARTHAPVRSPDRDGDIDDGDLASTRR